MSTTSVSATSSQVAPVDAIFTIGKNDKTRFQTLKEKLVEGKNYVLAHKAAFAKMGQIGGTAGLVVGGASLLFSGIAANLTIGGIPLGIPLMVAGGVLLVTGTVLQVMNHAEKEDASIAEKVKGFFKDSLKNITIGQLAGIGISAALSVMPLTMIATIAPIAIKIKQLAPYLLKDLNKEENWEGFVKVFLKESLAEKALRGSKTMDDFFDKYFASVKDTVKEVVTSLEKFDKIQFQDIKDKLSTVATEISIASLLVPAAA